MLRGRLPCTVVFRLSVAFVSPLASLGASVAWAGQRALLHVLRYGFAWLAGLMGGTLFSFKWLYHSAAKNRWHQDRLLWRFATPHLSSAVAFICICLIQSGLLTILNPDAVRRPAVVVSIGFLAGYFSDTALAKFADIAYTLFGTSQNDENKSKKEDKKTDDGAE